MAHLPRPQGRETLRRNARRVQGVRKCEQRCIHRFVGQLERAVMVSERNFCATIDQCLHRLSWVHEVDAHEQTRLISTDRQNSDFKWPVTLSRTAEIVSVTVARVKRHDKCARRALRSRTTPIRPWLRSDKLRADQCRDATSVTATSCADIDPIAPVISFGSNGRVEIAHDDVITERCDYARTMCGCYPRQSTDIEMIVVAVRHQNEIDRRQIGKGDAGVVNTHWAR